jgi:hypothetical protein
MADLKISALTSATTPLAGTEVVPIVQSSTTKKVAVSDLTAGRAVTMSTASVGTTISQKALTVATDQRFYNTAGDGATNVILGDISSQVRNYSLPGILTSSFASIQFATDPSTWYLGELRFATNGSDGTSTSPTTRMTIGSAGNITVNTGNVVFGTAAKGIFGSSPFSVTLANGAAGTILDLSVAMPAGSSGIVNVYGASAGKATILCQRDQGGYYSVTELGTQPRGTYITSISLSGTNLRITNSSGGSETFSGRITLMI